jgi:hypothetical protein
LRGFSVLLAQRTVPGNNQIQVENFSMASIPVTIQGVLTYTDPLPGGPPPGIWPGPGAPTHPIAPGGPPPGVWPPPGQPAHPIAPGGPPPGVWPTPPPGGEQPPGIWPGPGAPTHPIAPGGPPPGPSQGPGFPTPPIYIPITPPPDSGLSPEHPIYIPVYPAHPIELPNPDWQEIKEFLTGNLPPTPPAPNPV